MNNIQLINFVDLNLEEKELVLSWRNNPNTKKWMFHTDDISLEQHLKFIETLKSSKEKQYFVVKDDNKYIGVIDFCNITKENLEMGLYKNPQVHNVGKILLNTIIKYSFDILKVKTIISEVFAENEKARNLYKKYNFQEVGKKMIDDKKVICMELIKDMVK